MRKYYIFKDDGRQLVCVSPPDLNFISSFFKSRQKGQFDHQRLLAHRNNQRKRVIQTKQRHARNRPDLDVSGRITRNETKGEEKEEEEKKKIKVE